MTIQEADAVEIAGGLYLTERETAARVGVSLPLWRATARLLEKSGLPERDPLFAKRRYWPGVRRFLDEWNGMSPKNSALPGSNEAKESWD